MPPKIEWPTEKELRDVFGRYVEAGCVEREEQIDRFLLDFSYLNASRRSVLDLIRSFESGNGRVLETIRGRDERLAGTHGRPLLPDTLPKRRERKTREHLVSGPSTPRKVREVGAPSSRIGRKPKATKDKESSSLSSESPSPIGKGKAPERTSKLSKSGESVEEMDVGERQLDDHHEIERLEEKLSALEDSLQRVQEEKSTLNARYTKDHQSWSDKALSLEQENNMLSEENARNQLLLEERRTQIVHQEAELTRALADIKYWKEAALSKERDIEKLRQTSTDVERIRAERDALRTVIDRINPISSDAPPESRSSGSQGLNVRHSTMEPRPQHSGPSYGSYTFSPDAPTDRYRQSRSGPTEYTPSPHHHESHSTMESQHSGFGRSSSANHELATPEHTPIRRLRG